MKLWKLILCLAVVLKVWFYDGSTGTVIGPVVIRPYDKDTLMLVVRYDNGEIYMVFPNTIKKSKWVEVRS